MTNLLASSCLSTRIVRAMQHNPVSRALRELR